MAVVKESEIVVNMGLKEAYNKLEQYYRGKNETTMKDRELTEKEGYITVVFKKSMVSNGEMLTITLEDVEDQKTKVKMVSQSVVEKTKYDWGKNERNMKLVLEQLGVK